MEYTWVRFLPDGSWCRSWGVRKSGVVRSAAMSPKQASRSHALALKSLRLDPVQEVTWQKTWRFFSVLPAGHRRDGTAL